MSTNQTDPPRLRRRLGLFGNILLTLSGVTPAASVFVIAPEAMEAAGTGAFWSFVIAALVGIFVAMCFAELASAFPVAAGDYAFAARAIGKGPGFVMLVFDLVKGLLIIGVIAYGTAEYLHVVFPGLNPAWTGAVVIAATTVLAVFNIRFGALVTGIFLAVEMLAISVVAWLGLTNPQRPFTDLLVHPQFLGGSGTLQAVSLGVIMASVSTALFSYNGYQTAVWWSEETHGAGSGVARAIFKSLAITVVAELIPLTAVILGTQSIPQLVNAENPMHYFIVSLSNEHVYTAVSIGIAVAIFNAVLVMLLGIGRVFYCTARDQVWPAPMNRTLGRIHPRFSSPANATIAAGAVATAGTLAIPFHILVLLSAGGIVITYTFAAIGVLIGRITGRTAHAPYRMRWWPLAPAVLLGVSAYLLWNQDHAPQLVALSLATIAVVYYVLYLRPRRDTRWLPVDPDDEDGAVGEPTRAAERTGSIEKA